MSNAKTLEDFNLMTVPVLEGIILDLTGNKPKAKQKKDALVMLAFNLQQPDAPTETEQATAETSLDDLVGDTPDETDAPTEDTATDASELSVTEEPVPDVQQAPATPQYTGGKAKVMKALRNFDAQIHIENDCVICRKGEKRMTTTVNQPLQSIVNAVERFAK